MNASRPLPVLLALGALPFLCPSLRGQDSVTWLTDVEKARSVAAEAGKDLLLDFTGSDWCGWCIKLRDEVFDTGAFAAEAAKHFVFVELDFPRRKEIDAATKAQNERLQGELGVQGFPTIFLTDAEGRPYARTGYRPGGPKAYLAHLAELREARVRRDQAWTKAAAAAAGPERAQLLAAGLEAIEPDLYRHYAAVMEELVQAAGDGDLAQTWRPRLHEARLLPKVDALRHRFAALAEREQRETVGVEPWQEAGKAVAAFLAENEVQGDVAGELHYLHGMALFRADDHTGALAAFRRCKAASPALGERMQPVIDRLEAETKAAGEPGKDG